MSDERPKTTGQTIAQMAAADTSGIPFRKIADLIAVFFGCLMLVRHDHHDHIPWSAWVLFMIGAGDLGIQGAGALLNRYLGKGK